MKEIGPYLCLENETDWTEHWDELRQQFFYIQKYLGSKPQQFPVWFTHNDIGYLPEWILCDKEKVTDYVQTIIEKYQQIQNELKYL